MNSGVEKLGWSAERIARTRPKDIQRAVDELNIDTLPEPTRRQGTEEALSSSFSVPVVAFSRKLKSIPLITPFANDKVVVIQPDILHDPVNQLTETITTLLRRIDRHSTRRQSKLDLLRDGASSDMDLDETLALEFGIAYDITRLDRATNNLNRLKSKMVASLIRKQKVIDMIMYTQVDTDDEDTIEYNNIDKNRHTLTLQQRIDELTVCIEMVA